MGRSGPIRGTQQLEELSGMREVHLSKPLQ
ncbi:hypothetical protein LINGRAHAP2_LOCUS28528 [Linum grandiflorum]